MRNVFGAHVHAKHLQSIDYKRLKIMEAGGVGILTLFDNAQLIDFTKRGKRQKHHIRPSEVHGGYTADSEFVRTDERGHCREDESFDPCLQSSEIKSMLLARLALFYVSVHGFGPSLAAIGPKLLTGKGYACNPHSFALIGVPLLRGPKRIMKWAGPTTASARKHATPQELSA